MRKGVRTAIASIALISAVTSGTALAQTAADIPEGDPAEVTRDFNGGGISAGTIYFTGAFKEYGTIDPLGGEVDRLGTHGDHYADIAICPDKTMYGINLGGHLHEIDPADGSFINNVGGTGRLLTSLVCSTDGVLYGALERLYEIDRTDASVTAAPNLLGNGCVSAGDLEFDLMGDLYLTCFGGMVTVDPDTGLSTVVGFNGNVAMFGLASVNPLYTLWLPFISEISPADASLGDTFLSFDPDFFDVPIPVFFGAATLPRVGACCINGPGTATPCEIRTQLDCEQNEHVYLGSGTECTDNSDVECNELFVMIESMSARQTTDGVTVRWTTSVETETVGFRVLRMVTDGREKKVEMVGHVVPSAGTSFSGASYELTDDSKRSKLAEAYYIIDIDLQGKETRHGPIEIERVRMRGSATTRTNR